MLNVCCKLQGKNKASIKKTIKSKKQYTSNIMLNKTGKRINDDVTTEIHL